MSTINNRTQHSGVFVLRDPRIGAGHHETFTRRYVATGIAALLDIEFREEGFAGAYVIAPRTLLPQDAREWNIRGPDDVFGGVTPYPFVGTKAITHGLVSDRAVAPEGWNPRLGALLGDAVLRGHTAFTSDDARESARRLLALGAIRLKSVNACGGHDQWVAADLHAFEQALARIDPSYIRQHRVVVEQQLQSATTYSVGSLAIGSWSISYVGTQRETEDHCGRMVYGGSELVVTRGNFEVLGQLIVSKNAADAIRKAIEYDAAVNSAFPTFFASRRNYDVVCGTDARGNSRSGVLEQSWRVGGASPAEIAALLAFKADPALQVVCTATHEAYGNPSPPDDADTYFVDHGGVMGGLVKYVTRRPNGHPAQNI